MNSKWIRSTAAAAALALVLAGCGAKTNGNAASPDSSEGKLKVVATFYPMAEFSRQVGGNLVDVAALVPVGTEPHDWEPSAKDMSKISDADVFVYNGIVEEWAERALDSAGSAKRVAVEASSGIELLEGVEEEGHEGHDHEGDSAEESHGHPVDPHVWLSPALAMKEVRNIEAAFSQADPEHAEQYKQNADAYASKLQDLDEQFKSQLADVKRKDFITSHAAFAYLAKEYGLKQVPISGLSPEQEPSPEQMAQVVKFVKDNNVRTIFFETLADSKIADTIAAETGAGTDVLNPLEGLTQEETAAQEDYISIMEKNLAALKKALNE
ncbi:metal ABC transporter substrate-binding protein [Paenibacillus sp. P22]|uniref:metal ABC transporter substrate-binding protein n=1 Tax=Paenibacillus sp. P22 TaxID=483908 RepID=UPI000432BF54|nr:metal ABC transporter substrate-binding protein [Paenibacillus sp. P22]CDN45837.1 Probable zinc transport system zinc-binding lipoprotein AdcA [Paenibacillus sp. P22]